MVSIALSASLIGARSLLVFDNRIILFVSIALSASLIGARGSIQQPTQEVEVSIALSASLIGASGRTA